MIKGSYEPNPPRLRFVDTWGMLRRYPPPQSISYRVTKPMTFTRPLGRDARGFPGPASEMIGIPPGHYSVLTTTIRFLDDNVIEIPLGNRDLGDDSFEIEILGTDG